MAHILLVEDDDKIRKMMTLRLRLREHDVEVAENGEIGVDKAMAGSFDVVLMDMHMPVLDGHDATKKLRTLGYVGPIIAVTASVMVQHTQAALDSGCDHFISKPIDEDFEDQVEKVILDHQ